MIHIAFFLSKILLLLQVLLCFSVERINPSCFFQRTLHQRCLGLFGKIRKSAGTTRAPVLLRILRGNFVPFEPQLVVHSSLRLYEISKVLSIFHIAKAGRLWKLLRGIAIAPRHMRATLHKTGRCMGADLFCSTYAHIWLTLRKKETQNKSRIKQGTFILYLFFNFKDLVFEICYVGGMIYTRHNSATLHCCDELFSNKF